MAESIYGTGYQATGGDLFCEQMLEKTGIQQGDRILDLGCGTGGSAQYITEKYAADVVGVDLSQANIDLCRTRAEAQENDRLTYQCHDIRELPFGDSFDWFWSRDVLVHVREKTACLNKVAGLLKNGRTSVVIDFCRGEAALSREFDDHIYACDYHLASVPEYERIIGDAGFDLHEIFDFTNSSVESFQSDIDRFEQHREEFTSNYGEKAFLSLISRWEKKIRFCQNDEMLTVAYLVSPA